MHEAQRQESGARQSTTAKVLLALLVVAAFVLRFARLGHWGFDSDEIFMLRDSVHPRLTNPRPLLYLINHYVILPLMPLDEFGIRLLPAVFGVLAIPAFYWICRRLLGTRAALFGTLLLTLSGLHVIYSQFGRYWSLVFLLCAIYPYAVYLGVRERDRGMLAIGVVTGILASLAHPASVLLVGGPLLWFVMTYLRPRHIRTLWSQRAVRWGAVVLLVLAAVIAMRFVPFLQGWIAEHDENPGSGQFLLRAPMPMGVKQVFYLLAFVEGITIPVFLTAVVGIYLLWRGQDRGLAMFFTIVALFPITFLTLISVRTPVSTYYLLPTVPIFFMGAGYFLDRVFAVDWTVRPRWLVPVTVAILVLIPGTPTLVSQYLNGRRYDFKSAAQWLQPRLTANDVIFSDQPVVMEQYLPKVEIGRLRYNTAPLDESMHAARNADPDAALWIVAPAPAHALRTNLRQGGLAGWIYEHCQLRNSIGHGRVDFRQQYLQVYRCPPEPSAGAAARQTLPPAADSTSPG